MICCIWTRMETRNIRPKYKTTSREPQTICYLGTLIEMGAMIAPIKANEQRNGHNIHPKMRKYT